MRSFAPSHRTLSVAVRALASADVAIGRIVYRYVARAAAVTDKAVTRDDGKIVVINFPTVPARDPDMVVIRCVHSRPDNLRSLARCPPIQILEAVVDGVQHIVERNVGVMNLP